MEASVLGSEEKEGTRTLLGDLAFVKGAPNAGAARAFVNFLLSQETARALAARFPR